MKVVCFDVTGTLIDHKTQVPIPLMPKLLHSLQHEGWQLQALTSWGPAEARILAGKMSQAAGLRDADIKVVSSPDKAAWIKQLLRTDDVELVCFVDDKPEHLENVKQIDDARLRVIGFLGSRKYAPLAGERCLTQGMEYSLTAVDLATRFFVSLSHEFDDLKDLTIVELINLIPGLEHPCSATAGENWVFDHRMVPKELFERWKEWSDDAAMIRQCWKNLAWIKCDECMWKFIGGLIRAQIGFDEAIIGLDWLPTIPLGLQTEVENRLRVGLSLLTLGIQDVVGEADCPVQEAHIVKNESRCNEVFGSPRS